MIGFELIGRSASERLVDSLWIVEGNDFHWCALLQSDVGLAAPVLKELLGDVVIESRPVKGITKPQLFARFTLNALPAFATIERGPDAAGDYGSQTLWGYLGEDLASTAGTMPGSPIEIVVPLKRPGGKDDHGSQDDEA